MPLVKAEMWTEATSGKKFSVQFNPERLNVSYQSFGRTPRLSSSGTTSGSGEEQASQASSRTGYTASLSLDLLFDTSESGEDVRLQTLVIVQMLKPDTDNQAPLVYFQWGTFLFSGHIMSMTENLTYFSEQGTPLRAELNFSMSEGRAERKSEKLSNANSGLGLSASASLGVAAGLSASASVGASIGGSVGASVSAGLSAGAAIGTTPLTFSQSGESLQSLSARAGLDWRAVAEANNIDNPRSLQAGAVVNLNVKA